AHKQLGARRGAQTPVSIANNETLPNRRCWLVTILVLGQTEIAMVLQVIDLSDGSRNGRDEPCGRRSRPHSSACGIARGRRTWTQTGGAGSLMLASSAFRRLAEAGSSLRVGTY